MNAEMDVDMKTLRSFFDEADMGVVAADLKQRRIRYQNRWAEEHAFDQGELLRLLCETKERVCFREHEQNRYLLIFDRQVHELIGMVWVLCEQDLEHAWQNISYVEQMTAEYETILNSSSDEILVTDGEGRVLRANRVAEKLYGVPVSEIVGKSSTELERMGYYSPALWPIVVQRKEKVSMVQKTITGHLIYVVANPVFDAEGGISRIIFNSRDVTDVDNLRRRVQYSEETIERYRRQLVVAEKHPEDNEFVFESPCMASIYKLALKVAPLPSTVLITGESGVGKGVIARVIHRASGLKGDFISVNCGAIPESLVESELFGYDEGAFTGARRSGKSGLIELANRGTLFLDEISELPLNMQVKLLQVIQEREVLHVGGQKKIPVNIRIVAATNQNLDELVKQGKFRKDLYYRLNVIPIHMPPLRERREDLPYLIDAFLEKFNKKYGFRKQLSLSVENALLNYKWPGNVRELENIMERLLATTETDEVQLADLPEEFDRTEEIGVSVNRILPLKQALEQVERQLIQKAYQKSESSYMIAKMLGINQSTAYRKIQKYIFNQPDDDIE